MITLNENVKIDEYMFIIILRHPTYYCAGVSLFAIVISHFNSKVSSLFLTLNKSEKGPYTFFFIYIFICPDKYIKLVAVGGLGSSFDNITMIHAISFIHMNLNWNILGGWVEENNWSRGGIVHHRDGLISVRAKIQ